MQEGKKPRRQALECVQFSRMACDSNGLLCAKNRDTYVPDAEEKYVSLYQHRNGCRWKEEEEDI